MKKTIITLFALAGVASADWTAADANGWMYNNGTAWITNNATVTEDATTKDLTIKILDANKQVLDFSYQEDSSTTRACYTFAITLNLAALTPPTTTTSAAWGGSNVGFGLNGSTVTACIGSGSASWATTTLGLGSSGLLTLIVTSDTTGSMILAYGDEETFTTTGTQGRSDKGPVNGTTVGGGTYNGWTGLKEKANITTFTIDSSIAGAVEKFAVWDTKNTTGGLNTTAMLANMDTVAAAMKVIPEPTTATLSLLALAGLAARRRRR